MPNYEQLGLFYLGKICDTKSGNPRDDLLLYESKNLTTHAVCVGMTGSGKTGLGVALLEEAAIDGIPAIIIDPKGDLGNLLLTFPQLRGKDFLPWIDEGEAKRQGLSPEAFAEKTAQQWKEGLATWDESPDRIQKVANAVEHVIYTPASRAGLPIAILNSFAAPPPELLQDAGALRDRVLSTVSGLLGLLNINADPLQSREHILISTILEKAWRANQNIDLAGLIQQVQTPPFDKVGVVDLDTFYPAKQRTELAMQLNHLLASPGFQAWMEGEPLDVQRLLYTQQGKPKHSIVYIAHLSDSERMFFVTLLLNEIVAWMRRQTGTSSLRALLYMDEIFGFFPPSAAPSSKLPMLLLLKQARAYGLGVVLATQNPVDLDYKGLANCGTWFIGKLQTDRDRSKVIEGLKQSSGDTSHIDTMLGQCGSRRFVLHSIYQPAPLLFQTRWSLSFLSGPISLAQVQTLTPTTTRDLPSPPKAKAVETQTAKKPQVPEDIAEYFLPSTKQNNQYCPHVIGIAKLHFVDAKNQLDTWQERVFLTPALNDNSTKVVWTDAQDITAKKTELSRQEPASATFASPPNQLFAAKAKAALEKDLMTFLYQSQILNVYVLPDLKMISKPEESESDFRVKAATALREQRDARIGQVKQKYEGKIAALTDKVRAAQRKVDEQNAQVGRQKLDTYVSIGTTILGALFGRKRLSSATISRASSSVRRVSNISKEEEQAASAEESLKLYQEQLHAVQDDMQSELTNVSTPADPSQLAIDVIAVHPRKTDIAIEAVGIAWAQD